MKKTAIIILMAIALSGCSTAKYALEQTLGERPEGYDYTSMATPSGQDDNLLASADYWIKRHLW